MFTRRRSSDMFSLAGWLFADLFIILSIVFITSLTMATSPTKNKSVVQPTPTKAPQIRAIRSEPLPLLIKVENVDGLIAGDSAVITRVEQQITEQLRQKQADNLTAGIVLTFGGGPNSQEDVQIAKAINNTLFSIGEKKHLVFNKQTVFKDFIDLDQNLGIVTINIYVFAYR